MKNAMMSVAEATQCIESGAVLVIAGSEAALSQLPAGKWVGGTSVYFMTATGGRVDRENVFVTEFDDARDARVVMYVGRDLDQLTANRFENGLSIILIPAFSEAHADFALNGASFPGLFEQPLMGWISGMHLDDTAADSPKVVDGATATIHAEGAAVLHVDIGQDMIADIDIVNLFEQDPDADELQFTEDGFSAKTAIINGKETDLLSYISENDIDTEMPLVANYAGAMINVSFQSLDTESGVAFYAPVVAGVTYRQAKAPANFARKFAQLATGNGTEELSCNCILNYVYGELEGKKTADFTGPATFGEIAYILLNQTMVRVSLQAAAKAAVA
ncbi:hypothetical protein N4R57_14795 [Rhodobacteraceae bacterium D3-12]|nr:hypothetical protein N4R57_14795 [Rhodobacteraceae bacterium D3-12]